MVRVFGGLSGRPFGSKNLDWVVKSLELFLDSPKTVRGLFVWLCVLVCYCYD